MYIHAHRPKTHINVEKHIKGKKRLGDADMDQGAHRAAPITVGETPGRRNRAAELGH